MILRLMYWHVQMFKISDLLYKILFISDNLKLHLLLKCKAAMIFLQIGFDHL